MANDFVGTDDLFHAYRRAKVDALYEKDLAPRLDFNAYERAISKRLAQLRDRLRRNDSSWFSSSKFVGGFAWMPKTAELPPGRSAINYDSDDSAEWERRAGLLGEERLRRSVQFRLVAQPSVDFHVLSSLWIGKVGAFLDARLPDAAKGSRVRPALRESRPHLLPRGNFRSWLRQYQEWNGQANAAILRALQLGRRVAVLTLDAKSFYYNVPPAFLLQRDFIEPHGIRLTDEQRGLTCTLLDAMRAWAQMTPLHRGRPDIGLPVGLSAARVIANLSLLALDDFIASKLRPIHYGRYVDDIILALDITDQRAGDDVVGLLKQAFAHAPGITVLKARAKAAPNIHFRPTYFGRFGATLKFTGEKQKCMILAPGAGSRFARSLLEAARRRTSEWRILPDEEFEPQPIARDVNLDPQHEQGSETLRKAEPLTLRRNDLSLILRKLEILADSLRAAEWAEERAQFVRVLEQQILALPWVFDFSAWVPRCLTILGRAKDFAALDACADRISHTAALLNRYLGSEQQEQAASWLTSVGRQTREVLISCIDPSWTSPMDSFRSPPSASC